MRGRRRLLPVLTAVAAGVAGCGDGDRTRLAEADATVVRVVDGDTIVARASGDEVTVRLLGIDAPEASDTRYGRPDCGGAASGAFLRDRLRRGDEVRLVADATQDAGDRYGRLLRYVERDGDDLGRALVAAGWAEVYDTRDPFAREARYREAARDAREGRRGVWSACGGDFHSAGP